MSTQPRKHHYVPQGYLRIFSYKNNDHYKIKVFDKISQSFYFSNIENVAAQRDYNRDITKEDEFFWEKYFATTVEATIPHVLGNIIAASNLASNCSVILNDDLKLQLSKIIITQLLRTPTMRSRNKSIAHQSREQVLKNFKKEYYKILSPHQKQLINNLRFDDENYKSFELSFINDPKRLDKFTHFLLQRYWVVYRNPFSHFIPFITSDHPVNFYNYSKHSEKIGDSGLAVDDTVINYPICNNLLLCLYTPTHWMQCTQQFNNCVVDLNENEKNYWYIIQTNQLQYLNAYCLVFYKSDDD